MPAVSNSTPLIYLATLGDLDLLHTLFGQILIPRAVYDEVTVAGNAQPGADDVREATVNWLRVESVRSRTRIEGLVEHSGLDMGEAEAIVLAQESGERIILMDDQSAVREAQAAGLSVIRTAALYVIAKKYHLIERVRPKLDDLRSAGFWLGDDHYHAVLRQAGEL